MYSIDFKYFKQFEISIVNIKENNFRLLVVSGQCKNGAVRKSLRYAKSVNDCLKPTFYNHSLFIITMLENLTSKYVFKNGG